MVKIINERGSEKKDLKENYWIIENESISPYNKKIANEYLKDLKVLG